MFVEWKNTPVHSSWWAQEKTSMSMHTMYNISATITNALVFLAHPFKLASIEVLISMQN